VETVLRKQFPDHPLDVFDVLQLVKKRPDILLVNLFATVLLYGPDLIKRKKKIRVAFWRTPYIFNQVKKLIRKKTANGQYRFSFQMQSLFDCSTPGLPHFLYTDHTHLENLNYAANQKANLFAASWIELEKTIYQNTDVNFVRSSNVQRSMIQDYHCTPERVKLVYAGSNASVSSIKTANTKYVDPHILFIGFDWKRKGGTDLVEAFKLVLEKHPNAKLTIVGAKPDLEIPNCEVVGPVKPEELDPYYQRASIFCLPTHLEPFGIVFIEAMTARLPIVATRVGAIPDFVEEGKNGWLVEPGDARGLAESIMRLIENPNLAREFGEQSYQIIQERYSWEAVGRRFKEHIQHVLGR
jgi:glycosyltransferase involved in cell wall biosynthesis